MAAYVHPEVLVSTDWVLEHHRDPNLRIVESDEDILLYSTGHVPGAVKIDWHTDLQDQTIRDYVSPADFEKALRGQGISNDTTLVFYGDKNNWWRATPFGCSSCLGMRSVCSWTAAARNGNSTASPGARTPSPSIPPERTRPSRTTCRSGPCAMTPSSIAKAGLPLFDVRSPGEYTARCCTCPIIRKRAHSAAATFRVP